MQLHYLHHDTGDGDGLQLFLTEEELKAAQIELMEEARGNDGEPPDYEDEDEFGDMWYNFTQNATCNINYYFAGEVALDGIALANQPELKL